jgi:DNA-binding PadR family transcriptional regulator
MTLRVWGSIMTILRMLRDHSFDDAATRAMGQAFDRVCYALGECGKSEAIQESLAKRIIELAKKGETLDPYRLCDEALQAITATKSKQLAEQAKNIPLRPLLQSRA